jgi:hypothetical protein
MEAAARGGQVLLDIVTRLVCYLNDKEPRFIRNIYVTDFAIYYLKASAVNFLYSVCVQHLPYLCEHLTIYTPKMMKL